MTVVGGVSPKTATKGLNLSKELDEKIFRIGKQALKKEDSFFVNNPQTVAEGGELAKGVKIGSRKKVGKGFFNTIKNKSKQTWNFIADKAKSAFNFVKTQTKKAYGFIKTQATKAYGFVKNHKLAAGIVAGAVAVAAVVGAILYKTQNSEEV